MFNFFATRYREPLIVWFAILLHMLWAVDMYIDPISGWATAPYAVNELFGAAAPHLLIIGAALAFIGMVIPQRFGSVMLMVPQFWFLFISAVSAGRAILLGQFPDGVERSRLFILNDQGPAMILAALYTLAVIQIARSKDV